MAPVRPVRHTDFMTTERENEPTVIESCNSTWVFDAQRMRFRRILKGTEVGGEPVATGWRAYYRLDAPADSETFTVYLNLSGTRMIRSWRHDADCAQCGDHKTEELSLETLRAALNS
jgi:hypothetical protein